MVEAHHGCGDEGGRIHYRRAGHNLPRRILEEDIGQQGDVMVFEFAG